MTSVWKKRYAEASAKRSARAAGTTTSQIRRDKDRRRELRLGLDQARASGDEGGEAAFEAALSFIEEAEASLWPRAA